MDIANLTLVILFGLIFLLVIGMPLGLASGFLAVVTLLLKFGPDVIFRNFGTGPLLIIAQRFFGLMTDFVLISVPLFIFMAALLERSGIARDMFSSLNIWLNRTRGGIAIVTSVMAVVMAAMSGIIGGEIVLLGLIALPQMLRLGYDRNLAIGTLCASGSLGTMIPPSIVLIIYGLVTETSIHSLFKAAFVPGFILAFFYIVYIIVRTNLNPKLAPLPPASDDDMTSQQKWRYGFALLAIIAIFFSALILIRSGFLHIFDKVDEDTKLVSSMHIIGSFIVGLAAIGFLLGKEKIAGIKESWNIGKGILIPLGIVFVVLGSIYGGITGITEAAGMGVLAVILITVARGEFSLDLLNDALTRTLKSTGTILWVTFGATSLAGAYTIAGGPSYIANLIVGTELPTLGILLVMMLIFLILGAFMDWVGIVLLIMPVFIPIIAKLPIEDIGVFAPLVDHPHFLGIWFGILFCINMQVSFLTPPFGPAAFYLKSVAPANITLQHIFSSFLPFIAIQLLVLTLVLFFPELTMLFI